MTQSSLDASPAVKCCWPTAPHVSLTDKVRSILRDHTEEGILNVLAARTHSATGAKYGVLRAVAEAGLACLKARQAGLNPRIVVQV